MAHRQDSNAHVKAARMAYKLVKRQAGELAYSVSVLCCTGAHHALLTLCAVDDDDEESSIPVGRECETYIHYLHAHTSTSSCWLCCSSTRCASLPLCASLFTSEEGPPDGDWRTDALSGPYKKRKPTSDESRVDMHAQIMNVSNWSDIPLT